MLNLVRPIDNKTMLVGIAAHKAGAAVDSYYFTEKLGLLSASLDFFARWYGVMAIAIACIPQCLYTACDCKLSIIRKLGLYTTNVKYDSVSCHCAACTKILYHSRLISIIDYISILFISCWIYSD